jgi:hypothetical protein
MSTLGPDPYPSRGRRKRDPWARARWRAGPCSTAQTFHRQPSTVTVAPDLGVVGATAGGQNTWRCRSLCAPAGFWHDHCSRAIRCIVRSRRGLRRGAKPTELPSFRCSAGDCSFLRRIASFA